MLLLFLNILIFSTFSKRNVMSIQHTTVQTERRIKKGYSVNEVFSFFEN